MIRLIRYFFVGGAAAVVDFVLFAGQVKVSDVPWYYAGVVSFIAATLVNYLLSIRFVFQSGVRFSKNHEIALVFLVSAVGLAINQAVLFLLIAMAAVDPLAAKVGATGAVFFWNYAARLKFVFGKA